MLGLALELVSKTLSISTWLFGQTFNGIKYLVYGSDKDQVISKIEELENKLNHLHDSENSKDQKFYWKTKHQYSNYDWVVISQQTLLCQTNYKAEALVKIASHSEEEPENKCLLVQVGNEINMYQI